MYVSIYDWISNVLSQKTGNQNSETQKVEFCITQKFDSCTAQAFLEPLSLFLHRSGVFCAARVVGAYLILFSGSLNPISVRSLKKYTERVGRKHFYKKGEILV